MRRAGSGTKALRGTRANAAKTRASRIPSSIRRLMRGPSVPSVTPAFMRRNLRFVREVRKAEAGPFGIADVERPLGAVDDLDVQAGEPLLPRLAVVFRD